MRGTAPAWIQYTPVVAFGVASWTWEHERAGAPWANPGRVVCTTDHVYATRHGAERLATLDGISRSTVGMQALEMGHDEV